MSAPSSQPRTVTVALVVIALLLLGGAGTAVNLTVALRPHASPTESPTDRTAPGSPAYRALAAPASGPTLTWTNLNLAHSPATRISGAMVYDSTDGYVVLFGGYNFNLLPSLYFNDTWTFADGAWTNVTPIHSPSTRMGFMMADDPADHAVVLYGGFPGHNQGTVPLNDTWEFKAGVWTNVTAGAAPPGRFWGGMSYDSGLGEVLLFGGNQANYPVSKEYSNDTWAFHAGTWTQLNPSTTPPGRDGDALADDVADSSVVVFGGLNNINDLNDTWTYASGTWTQTAVNTGPDLRTGAGLTYDAAAQYVVMYGGYPSNTYYWSTWLYHAGVWSHYEPNPTPPSGTIWGQMTYDAADQKVLLFEDDASDNQTWELTITTGSPPPLSVQGSVSPLFGTAPLQVNFSATASGGTPPYASSWTFGDTTSASSANVSHTYTSAGYYDAVLNVSDAAGAYVVQNWTIQVNSTTGPPLSVTASVTPLLGDAPLPVTFTALGAGGTAPYAYSWAFGDSASSTAENTTHTYATVGSFSVVLTVTDAADATVSKSWTVVIQSAGGGPPLSIAASATPQSGTVPLVVTFTASATGGTAPYSFAWTFGDGASSATENTSTTYTTAGAFTANLTVTDHVGGSASRSWTITTVLPKLVVTAHGTPASVSVGGSVAFVSLASGGLPPYSYAWEFGDSGTAAIENASHSYALAGTFVATVTVHDSRGASATANVTITVSSGGSSTSSTSFGGWDEGLLAIVIVLAAILILLVYARRRRKRPAESSAPPAPSGPTSPPP